MLNANVGAYHHAKLDSAFSFSYNPHQLIIYGMVGHKAIYISQLFSSYVS